MQSLWTALKIAASILVIGYPVLAFIMIKRMQKKQASFPQLTVEELHELARKRPLFYCNKATEELKSRGEDYSFALPLFLKLAINGEPMSSKLGWNGLKTHFKEQLGALDFTKDRPSAEEVQIIERKLSEFDKL